MDIQLELLDTFGDAAGEVSAKPKVGPVTEFSGMMSKEGGGEHGPFET